MELKEKLAQLAEKTKEIENLKKNLIDESAKFFDEFIKDFFIQYPQVKSFSWTQYTPYFNDGDSCTFNVNTDYISINGDHIDDCDWYDEKNVTNWGTYDRNTRDYIGKVEVDNPKYNKTLSEATDMIVDFLGKFNNDFYSSKFGDHVKITVTREGVEKEDYEHD
jgi:hypothetical protein